MMPADRSSRWLSRPYALALHRGQHQLLGRGSVGVRHQVTEPGVAVVADGGVERHGVLRPALELDDALQRHAHRLGELLDLRLGPLLAGVLPRDVAHPVDVLHEVDGQPHGALLLGDGPADRLADPPGGVRRELVAAHVVELLHGANEAGVALLDQVEHRHPGAHVPPGDRDHQAQVGPDEHVLRLGTLRDELAQLGLRDALGQRVLLEEELGEEPRLDGLGEVNLLGRVQQRRPRNLMQVDTNEVALLGNIVGP